MAGLGYSRNSDLNPLVLVLSNLFMAGYVPLVILRLPVFRRYYVKERWEMNKTHHNFQNSRAAPVAVALVAGVTLLPILLAFNVANPGYHSACGAMAALVISLYYDPRWQIIR